MAIVRWSIETWQNLLQSLFRPEHIAFFPHKIFRWDAQGIYRDCYYPFPCEHFLGGETILGKSVKDVLPKNVGHVVQKTLRATLRQGQAQEIQCMLPAGKQFSLAAVRFFPYSSEALGFVTDYDLSGKPLIEVTPDHPSIGFLTRSSRATLIGPIRP